MEKQPDKLDILMDWFLGDAKEITSKLPGKTPDWFYDEIMRTVKAGCGQPITSFTT